MYALDRNGTVVTWGDWVKVEGSSDQRRVVALADAGVWVEQWVENVGRETFDPLFRRTYQFLRTADRSFTFVSSAPSPS